MSYQLFGFMAENAMSFVLPADRMAMMVQANFQNHLNESIDPNVQAHIEAIHASINNHLPDMLKAANLHLPNIQQQIQADPQLSGQIGQVVQDINADLGTAAGPVNDSIALHMGNIKGMLQPYINGAQMDMSHLSEQIAPEVQQMFSELQPYGPQIEQAMAENAGAIQDVLHNSHFQQIVDPFMREIDPHLQQLQAEIAPHVDAIVNDMNAYNHAMHWGDPQAEWQNTISEHYAAQGIPDMNGDGHIDQADYQAYQAQLQQQYYAQHDVSTQQTEATPNDWTKQDMNADGDIDMGDYKDFMYRNHQIEAQANGQTQVQVTEATPGNWTPTDMNNDGDIDMGDYKDWTYRNDQVEVRMHSGEAPRPVTTEATPGDWTPTDMNDDGDIDMGDYNAWQHQMQSQFDATQQHQLQSMQAQGGSIDAQMQHQMTLDRMSFQSDLAAQGQAHAQLQTNIEHASPPGTYGQLLDPVDGGPGHPVPPGGFGAQLDVVDGGGVHAPGMSFGESFSAQGIPDGMTGIGTGMDMSMPGIDAAPVFDLPMAA